MTTLRQSEKNRSDLGEFDRAVAETGDPELPARGTEGGKHLERTFSFDPQAFPEPNSRQELWRFAPLPRLRALFAGPDADGEVAYSWAAGAPVEVVTMDDARVGTVHTPFDRVSAFARQKASNAVVVTVDGAAEPITLTGKGSGGVAYGHIVIEAKPHAQGTVVLDHVGSATYADNVEIRVGDGAALTVVTIQDWDDDAVHVGASTSLVGRDAKLRHINVSFGGDVVRLTPLVKFAGPGGDAEMLGLFFAASLILRLV